MVIFHSYVSLPEGKSYLICFYTGKGIQACDAEALQAKWPQRGRQ